MEMKHQLKKFAIAILASCVLSVGAVAQRDDKKPPEKPEKKFEKVDKDKEKKDEPRRDDKNQSNDNRRRP